MKNRWTKRWQLKDLLGHWTGCGTQHSGWPCNSCFHTLEIGVTDDELHRMWEATLRLRGDYSPNEIAMTDTELTTVIDALLAALQQRTAPQRWKAAQ